MIKYYKEYNILEKKEIYIEEVKTITSSSCVHSLLLLKDGRVASCSDDKTIRIYNPSTDYHCDQVIDIHSIIQLDDGTIVSCTWNRSIIIGVYPIKDAHDDEINKLIPLPDNRIASCSRDNTIKIWKSNPPYSDKPIIVLIGHSEYVWSILYIKERDIMISGSDNRTLRFWNMSTYQCDTLFEEVECCSINSLYQLDKDRVIVGGSKSFCIVNIDKCVIEKKIEDDKALGDFGLCSFLRTIPIPLSFDDSFCSYDMITEELEESEQSEKAEEYRALGYVTCFLKLRDNKTILCGCDKGIFCFYNMETKQYRKTKSSHNNDIKDLLLIDEHTFLSCSRDKTIKVWKY